MTSIEFLRKELHSFIMGNSKLGYDEIIEQSKLLHKQEILNAFTQGASDGFYGESDSNREQYYQETFVREDALQFLATQAQELDMGYTIDKWQVRFKDIDPDSGEISQDVCIATCAEESLAQWTKESIEKAWYSVDGSCDPNREFYIKPVNY